MTYKKSLIALSAALAIGLLGAASVAQASSDNQSSDRSGFVMPGSMEGVNPAYHPDLFGSAHTGNAGSAYGNAGSAYGYAPLKVQKHHPVR
jgi:hypothetical protein